MKIIRTFYHKQPQNLAELLPSDSPKYVTFLNPYSIYKGSMLHSLYNEFDYICSDGSLPIILQKIFNINRSERVSFDMTSFADTLLNYAQINNKSVCFIGSTPDNIKLFEGVISKSYPALTILPSLHGYCSLDVMITHILRVKPDIIVLGLGTPLQDQVAIDLKKNNYTGTVYTCGGFIHQTTSKLHYYPKLVDKFNLRFLYRCFKEPYVISRIILYYPRFTIRYCIFCLGIKLR